MSTEAVTEYNGPDENEYYSNEDESGTLETFDDFDFGDEETPIEVKTPTKISAKAEKKEQEKKDLGRKGDDLEVLDTIEEDEGTPPAPKDKDTEEEEESETKLDKKDEKEETISDEKKAEEKSGKGKKTYIKIGEDTFGISNDALIPTIIDGKKVEVSLQELKNEYSGKKYAEQELNRVSVEKQKIAQTSKQLQESVARYKSVADNIAKITADVDKNPKEAFKIFLDAFGLDTYDLEERMMKHDLQELSSLLQMSEIERRAYLLEKKNSHLLSLAEKRSQNDAQQQKVNTYAAKVDQLRKSFGVSEAQYVDAHEELLSKGYKDSDLEEEVIVEWAATKPHRSSVQEMLKPYEDDFSDDAYGELTWTLAKYLATGQATKEQIQKHLQEVYGVPSIVKDLNEKFNPIGRKSGPPKSTPAAAPKKHTYESFDDFEDEE